MLPPVSWSADEMSTVSSDGDGAEQPELTQINDLAEQSCAVLCCAVLCCAVLCGCGKDDDMDGGWMGAVASMVQCYTNYTDT